MSTRKKLGRGAIGTGAGTLIYTVPQQFKADVTDIDVANTTSGALTLILHFVPSGSSPATATQFCPTISIPANSMFQWIGRQTLNAGDFIQAIGSGSGLNIHVSGDEYR